MMGRLLGLWIFVFALVAAPCADGIRLETFQYPFEVKTFRFTSQQQSLEMAYMDVPPASGKAKGAVVLLHGKNFSGAYWEQTAKALQRAGYRVIMPDQVGFGKSSKPPHYQFTFQQLAENTRALLDQAGIQQAHIIGHSMGGMLATRYALMFPERATSLTLLNPIGLEDWKAEGVPYTTLDAAYKNELGQTAGKIRAYQLENYYDGKWKAEYDRWVEMLGEFIRSPDYPRMAWNQALTSDMIFTQPVLYEFSRLKTRVLLVIGQRDRTALGKNLVGPELRQKLGNYPELGRRAAKAIPEAKLVELEGIGHMPHIEAFEKWNEPLQSFLDVSSANKTK